MTAEQLISGIQKLIGRGTISSSAKVKIFANDVKIVLDEDDIEEDFEFDNLEIDGHESSYNKLVLFVE